MLLDWPHPAPGGGQFFSISYSHGRAARAYCPPGGTLAMVFVVRATNISGRGGTFASQATTKRAALRNAKRLRDVGLLVTITGPDGKPVDETEEPGEADDA